MTAPDQPAISVEALCVFAGQDVLLGPISFQVGKGGTLIIIGETGAGKSLAVQAILGTLHGSLRAEGRITVNGRQLDSLTPGSRAALWGRELAALPQEPWCALDPLMRSYPQVHEAYRFVSCLSKRAAGVATDRVFGFLDLHGAGGICPARFPEEWRSASHSPLQPPEVPRFCLRMNRRKA